MLKGCPSAVSFALSGANSLSVSDNNAASLSVDGRVGITKLLTGLTPGTTTITRYAKRNSGSGSTNVYARIEAISF